MSATERETDLAMLLRLIGVTPHEFMMDREKFRILSRKEFAARVGLLVKEDVKPCCPNCACAEHPNGHQEGKDDVQTKLPSVPRSATR